MAIQTSDTEQAAAPAVAAPGTGQVHPGGRRVEWNVQRTFLKYMLGERTLYRAYFKLAVSTAHFTELPEDQFCTFPGWAAVPPEVEGFVVRSQPVGARLDRLKTFPGAIRYIPAQYQRYYVELTGSFADYLQKFSSNSRQKRKREVRKFAESSGGTLDLREYRTPGEMEEFLRLGRELSSKTFQERLLHAGLPSDEAFRQSVLERSALGLMRAYILFHAGKPASYLINEIRYPGIAVTLYTGYDPQYRALSPGSIVYYLAIERMFAEGGLRMLDFTEGEGLHKQYFSTGSRQCADVYFFRPSPRVRALLWAHSALDLISHGAVRCLDRLGLKARVKKFIRARA